MQVMGVRGMGVVLGVEAIRSKPVFYGEPPLNQTQLGRLGSQLLPVLREKKGALLINHVAKDKDFRWLAEYASQLLAVPMLRRDQVLGCFFALDKLRNDFDSVDSKLLTSIANESAIYLENAILFGDLKELMMGLLHSLTSAVDAKDAYT